MTKYPPAKSRVSTAQNSHSRLRGCGCLHSRKPAGKQRRKNAAFFRNGVPPRGILPPALLGNDMSSPWKATKVMPCRLLEKATKSFGRGLPAPYPRAGRGMGTVFMPSADRRRVPYRVYNAFLPWCLKQNHMPHRSPNNKRRDRNRHAFCCFRRPVIGVYFCLWGHIFAIVGGCIFVRLYSVQTAVSPGAKRVA